MTDALTTALPPHAYDLIGLLIIMLCALRGARRGLVRELLRVLSLLAAIAFAPPLGALLAPHLPFQTLPRFLQTPIAFSIGALCVYLFTRILLSLLARWSGIGQEQEGIAKIAFQVGGACLRAGVGLLVCISIGWTILSTGRLSVLLVQSASQLDAPPWMQAVLFPLAFIAGHSDAFGESFLGQLSSRTNPFPRKLIEGAEMLVVVLETPDNIQKLSSFEPLQAVIREPSIQELLKNQEVRFLAGKKDIPALLNHAAVKKAFDDPAVQEALQKIDLEEMKRFLAK